MKPFFLFSVLICLAIMSMGYLLQKPFNEGVLQYDISIVSAKNNPATLNSLNGAVITLYLKQGQSRSEMTSSLGTESTVFNNNSGNGFILKEYSGQKLMITLNAANWEQKNKANNNLLFNISNEMINIGNYKCKKATASMPDGKLFTVYFDPSVTLSNKNYNNAFSTLNGLPVQYEIQSGDLTFKYSLKNLNSEIVPAIKFEAPKTGYRLMTYEENQQLKKG
ncbi:MAG TPA: hypothetical protein PK504_10920 [Ferruginibacter sp.]|nr:hypothetical protein [Ferruginibacter sp.]HRE64029.1 hypothetical protein [Ferruginibacter sp.]